jgi:hypothetical protein
MEQSQFLERKEKLLNEVSDECHGFALKVDLDFYVFQTPCDRYNPKLLLIGINPGGSKPYRQALEGKGYDKRPASDLGNDIMSSTDKESADMRNFLKRVFSKDNDFDILNDTVIMNMLYFNTDREKNIAGIESEIRKYCINKTLEFIEILNPQNILFFTSNYKNLSSYGVKNITVKEAFVKQGILGNRTVYAIPHYKYVPRKAGDPYPYSKDECMKIVKLLNTIFE